MHSNLQCRVPCHTTVVLAALVDGAAGSQQISVADDSMLKQDAVRAKMVAGADSYSAKHNGVWRKKIEITQLSVMGDIGSTVNIISIPHYSIAKNCTAALKNIALADNGGFANGCPGMNKIHKFRATFF